MLSGPLNGDYFHQRVKLKEPEGRHTLTVGSNVLGGGGLGLLSFGDTPYTLAFHTVKTAFFEQKAPNLTVHKTLLSFSRFSLLLLPPKVSPYIFVLHREPTDTLEIDRVGPHGPHPLLRVLALSPGHVLAELPLCMDWDMALGLVTHGLAYTAQKPGGTGLGEAELLKQETIRSIPCPWTSLPSCF